VKLLPGQLLSIQQTVQDAHAPPLPHRPPMPSFESPYAEIDDLNLGPDTGSVAAHKQPTEKQPDKKQSNEKQPDTVEDAANADRLRAYHTLHR